MKRSIIALVAILISASAYLLGWSDLLPVKQIVINEKDKEIVAELERKLAQPPRPIVIGDPIARVDKREITARLRALIWVDGVDVRRNFISGAVQISVEPRSAIAQLDSKWRANPADLAFLGSNLEIFFVPKSEVDKAGKSGNTDWMRLPLLNLGSQEIDLREDLQTLMNTLIEAGAQIRELSAQDRENLSSRIIIDGRELDIFWGSVKELPLKLEVLQSLMELKANREVKRVDLSSPRAPIVSKNR